MHRDLTELSPEPDIVPSCLSAIWADSLYCGGLPLPRILEEYPTTPPVFGLDFLSALEDQFPTAPEPLSETLSYVFSGPLQNLQGFHWGDLMPVLLQLLPDSFDLLLTCLRRSVAPHLDLRDCFLDFGGFESLSRLDDYDCSILLLTIVPTPTLFNDRLGAREPVCELSSDFGPIEFEPDFDLGDSIWPLCDRLLASESIEVRLNTLNALQIMAEMHERRSGNISNCVLVNFEHFVEPADVLAALNVLAISVRCYDAQYLGDVLPKLKELIECGIEEIVDGLTKFLGKIFGRDYGEILWGKEIVGALLEAAQNAPFARRAAVMQLLLQAVETCNLEQLAGLIECGLVPCFVDFLAPGSEQLDAEILAALDRILSAIVVNDGYVGDFCMGRDVWAGIAECENEECARIAQRIMDQLNDLE
jgi:hypothetical protein